MTATPTALSPAGSLASLLELEVLDRDVFRGHNARHGDFETQSLFGGQVAAQALRAVGHTVADDRFPHSLHGYFLRRGRPELPVLYHVARDRDGRSFSSRHVNAVQDGEVIFSMLASFHVEEPSGTWEPEPHRQVDPPATVVATPFWDALVDVRELTPSDEANGRYCDLLWVRAAHPLPDDPIVHACALTYVSDFGSGFGQVTVDGMASSGTSLDHAVWFQSPLRLDDWVLVDLWPTKAGGARGLYAGSIRGADGRLGAMIGQEMLQRQHHSADS